MRAKGRIASWNDEKGFGFITPAAGGRPVFVHIKAFSNRGRRPEVDEVVTYGLSVDPRGRPCAVQATLAGDRLPEQGRRANGAVPVVIAASFLVMVGLSALAGKTPSPVPTLYVAVSLLTFAAYAADKAAARSGAWRTPESTLHLLALAGGWPGALVAQQRLRHKSSKQPFRAVFWLTVLLNCALLVWLHTPGGESLRALLVAVA